MISRTIFAKNFISFYNSDLKNKLIFDIEVRINSMFFVWLFRMINSPTNSVPESQCHKKQCLKLALQHNPLSCCDSTSRTATMMKITVLTDNETTISELTNSKLQQSK